jgi:ribose transport system permease protein
VVTGEGSSGRPPALRSLAEKLLGAELGRRTARQSTLWEKAGMPVIFAAVATFFAFQSDVFLTQRNLFNIGNQASITAIAAIGATFVFISGGIDISQGGVMAFAGLVAVIALNGTGLPDLACLLLALLAGAGFGGANGVLAEIIRIPAFIATLGTALVIRGGAFVWTEGFSVGIDPGRGDTLSWLGQGYVGSVPAPLIIAVCLYVVAAVSLRKTVWGRHTYAIGSNEEAARIAGIHIRRHRIQVYTLAGALSAAAGVVLAARLSSAAPTTATGAEFSVITAVVLGGVSIFGGHGRIFRVLVASIFLATLNDGMVLVNIPTYYQQIVSGGVFLAALALDRIGPSR